MLFLWSPIVTELSSLDVFSLFRRLFFFLQYRIKNIWSPLGIEPRTACIAHKHSATELRQPPPGEQTIQLLLRGYCYASLTLNRPEGYLKKSPPMAM